MPNQTSAVPSATVIPATTATQASQQAIYPSAALGAANQVQAQASGGCPQRFDIAAPVSLACQPLYRCVTNEMREKIISRRFIDMASLIDTNNEASRDGTLKINEAGFIQLPPPRRKYLDINRWTDAFSIYSSVLREHNPNLREHLATYQNVIRGIASSGGNWYYYDTNFRRMRESSPELSWHQLVNELYIQALTRRPGSNNQQSRRFQNKGARAPFRSPRQNTPLTCHKFNKNQPCDGC